MAGGGRRAPEPRPDRHRRFSGLWIGLFVGIALGLFSDQNQLGFRTGPLLGAVFGLLWSQIRYSATTQFVRRDFASVSQILATNYELLVKTEHAVRAQHLLSNMPPGAAIWSPDTFAI